MGMRADGAAKLDTVAIAEGRAGLQPQPNDLYRQRGLEQCQHGEIAGGDRWQMHEGPQVSIRVVPGHRVAMNPESPDGTTEIPRCAIAHLRFALTRALSDKRYALARGMTTP